MKQLIITFVLLLGLVWTNQAQTPFLTLVEESTTSKYRDSIPANEIAIVDVNSRIRIKINNAALQDEMFRFQGISAQDSRLLRLRKLNQLLRHQNRILELFNKTFKDADKTKIALRDYKQFAVLLDDLQGEIEDDDELIALIDNPEMDAKFLDFDGPYALFLVDFLEKEADKVRKSLLSELGADGKIDSSLMVYFRLGAFIKNKSGGRAVHVENFDDYVVDQYFEISRFGAPLSEKEKIALSNNKLVNDSIQLNSVNLTGHFKEIVRMEVNEIFPSDSARIHLKDTYQRALKLLSLDPVTKTASRVLLDNELSLEQVSRLYSFSVNMFDGIKQDFPTGLLNNTSFSNQLDDLVKLAGNSYQTYAKDVSLYASTTSSLVDGQAAGIDQLNLVEIQYQTYVDSLRGDIRNVKNIVAKVGQLLQPFKKTYLKNEEFSKKVRRFMAGNIPSEGFIELKGIAERKAGDEILIKALLERGQDKRNPNYESREIYRRYVRLSRISPYFKMSGSLVLANPYSRSGNLQIASDLNKFQFAPTYGVFMKWGSRKSKFYNDFLNFGVGLGFSSPDFNLDGTPEFGAGFMLTGLRDIVSVGWGWNFGIDTPYTFIGFNLPFTVGGLPSASNASGLIQE